MLPLYDEHGVNYHQLLREMVIAATPGNLSPGDPTKSELFKLLDCPRVHRVLDRMAEEAQAAVPVDHKEWLFGEAE